MNSWVEYFFQFISQYTLVFICTMVISIVSCILLKKLIVVLHIKPIEDKIEIHKKKLNSKVNQDDVKLLINRDINEMESKIDKKLDKIIDAVRILHDALVHKGIIIPKYVSD